MTTVTTVYRVAEHRRTAEQFMGLAPREGKRPRVRNKRVGASLEREMSQVIEEQFREALRRDSDHERPWLVLLDGNPTQPAGRGGGEAPPGRACRRTSAKRSTSAPTIS